MVSDHAGDSREATSKPVVIKTQPPALATV